MKAAIKNLRTGERKRIVHCKKCGAEFSADKADYFWAPGDYELKCCGQVMVVVIKTTSYININ